MQNHQQCWETPEDLILAEVKRKESIKSTTCLIKYVVFFFLYVCKKH